MLSEYQLGKAAFPNDFAPFEFADTVSNRASSGGIFPQVRAIGEITQRFRAVRSGAHPGAQPSAHHLTTQSTAPLSCAPFEASGPPGVLPLNEGGGTNCSPGLDGTITGGWFTFGT